MTPRLYRYPEEEVLMDILFTAKAEFDSILSWNKEVSVKEVQEIRQYYLKELKVAYPVTDWTIGIERLEELDESLKYCERELFNMTENTISFIQNK